MFGRFRKTEKRAQQVTQASPDFLRVLGMEDLFQSQATDITVTEEKALGVPAVWSAVNFLASTIAGLPLHVYRRNGDDRSRVRNGVGRILHDAVNDETSSYQWRKYMMERVLTGGRAFTFIERNGRNQIVNLWPLEPARVTVERRAGRTRYKYDNHDGRNLVYEANEIIDIPFFLDAEMLKGRSPINTCRNAIAMAIASTNYSAKYFNGGGVPPFAVTGNFQSSGAIKRATDDLEDAVRKAAKDKRAALVLPSGLDIKPIGGDPQSGQLIEAKRFAVEEIARVYSLPPIFLQDLSHGTFSNTEQQDLHFVKHTVRRWVEQIEQEMNLKIFGRNSDRFCEFSLEGLLRGDFKTRMEGHAQAIQHGVSTPNEARRIENREPLEGGDELFIQGATVPLNSQGQSEGENE